MSNVSVQASSQEQAGSELAEFFGGKTVLLTGATGFVGKVLLAHLLAISPKILRIYCLIRGDISTRFQKDVLAAPFFKDMLKHNPSLKDKLQVRNKSFFHALRQYLASADILSGPSCAPNSCLRNSLG